jgi:hypothetical protein
VWQPAVEKLLWWHLRGAGVKGVEVAVVKMCSLAKTICAHKCRCDTAVDQWMLVMSAGRNTMG